MWMLTAACWPSFAGRRFGTTRWPFPSGTSKTYAGSLAFFVSSTMATLLFVEWFYRLGWTDQPAKSQASAVLLTHLAAMGLELLAPNNCDNLVVFFGSWPLAARLLV